MESASLALGSAGQNRVVEGFVLRLAGGALRVPIVGPGGMRCQITFTSPHLVDPPRREAVEAHEDVGCRGGFVEVVQGRWCLEGPVVHEQRSGLPFQRGVGFCSRGDRRGKIWEEM